MTSKHIHISSSRSIPVRYAPPRLTPSDRKKQLQALRRSRSLYKRGIYYTRPQIASFPSRKSNHLEHAHQIYKIKDMSITPTLARKTRCSMKTLKKIVKKGEGAYFSSGSRPSQTAKSWGYARLASALTGGKSSIVDYHLLKEGCQPHSLPIRLARKTAKKYGKVLP